MPRKITKAVRKAAIQEYISDSLARGRDPGLILEDIDKMWDGNLLALFIDE